MKTTALILAGGNGSRVGATVPKQFLEVNGKPILVHTLEHFQAHPEIDAIVIVCIEGWEVAVEQFLRRYGLTKVRQIVPGGSTAIQSIRNGIRFVEGDPDDIVLIHESVRPLIDARMISDSIEKSRIHGAAMSATPLKEHVFFQQDTEMVSAYYPRERAFKSASPHAYRRRVLEKGLRIADAKGPSYQPAFSSTLMIDAGIPVALSLGSDLNIKITTPQDIALFQALLCLD